MPPGPGLAAAAILGHRRRLPWRRFLRRHTGRSAPARPLGGGGNLDRQLAVRWGLPAPRAETQLVRRREDAKDARFLGFLVSRTSLTRSTSSRWLPRINNTEAATTLSLYVEAARFGKPDIFFYDALCRRNVKKRKEYIAAKRAFREVATAFRRHRSVA